MKEIISRKNYDLQYLTEIKHAFSSFNICRKHRLEQHITVIVIMYKVLPQNKGILKKIFCK